jgi:hypothetical protein
MRNGLQGWKSVGVSGALVGVCVAQLGCGYVDKPVRAAQAAPSVLAQLDAASARFKNAQADVRYDNYTAVVREHDLQAGSMYIERAGGGEQMGAIFYNMGEDGRPAGQAAKILAYGGGTLQVYTPGTKQDDIFKAGANQAKYESFLTLGFGGSGKDLAAAWTINDQGAETIDGVKTEKLDLVSKDASVRNMFAHVTIWVDVARGISLKQVFFAPGGDTRTAVYSNVRLNGRVEKKAFAIPGGATKVAH